MKSLKKLLYLFIVIVLVGSAFVKKIYQYFISPPKSMASPKIFVIPKGTTGAEIAFRLKEEGFIRNSLAFRLLLKKTGLGTRIQPGDFLLSATMSAYQIALNLTSPLDVWVTILEGWRVEEIAGHIISSSQFSHFQKEEFLKEAKPLEGFLFPDTYLIPKNASASAIIKTLSDNFSRRVDEALREEISKKGWSLYEVVNLASIVEREARFDQDRPIVAGILIKRLKSGMPLQADATVQYAKSAVHCPPFTVDCEWWPRELTKADLELNSPYNTRKFLGLPPTPICNPGLASIKAVVFPKETEYWYYLSDKDGRMHYAVTLEEHNQNINIYLQRSSLAN